MNNGRTYYCSSPTLDWRLSGTDTIEGYLRPDPLVYPTQESLQRLLQNTDVVHGLGIPPPAPAFVKNKVKMEGNAKMKALPSTSQVAVKATTKVKHEDAAEKVKTSPSSQGPRTPPSSGHRRVGLGAQGSNSAGLSQSQVPNHPNITTPPSASPLGIRKRKTPASSSSSPQGKKGVKWAEWEDQIIKKSIVAYGEKVTDWHTILAEINERRAPEEPRSIHSVKFHWSQQMRPKWLA